MNEMSAEKLEVSYKVCEKIQTLCDELGLSEDAHGTGTVCGSLQSARVLGEYMVGDMRAIAERVEIAEDEVYDRDLGAAADELYRFIETYRQLQRDMERMGEYVRDTALCLRDLVTPHEWEILYTDDEIKSILEERFVPDSDMFIAYRAGEYAFIFRKDDEESEPFVFARGGEDSYPAIEAVINRFLDIDDVIEEDEEF